MRELLEAVFAPLNAGLGAIPLSAARWITVGFLLLFALSPLLLRTDEVFRGAPRRSWHRDLRLWAILCMLPYILIYLVL